MAREVRPIVLLDVSLLAGPPEPAPPWLVAARAAVKAGHLEVAFARSGGGERMLVDLDRLRQFGLQGASLVPAAAVLGHVPLSDPGAAEAALSGAGA